MLIVIAIAKSEYDEITTNQSGYAIDLSCTVNLRNTFPDRLESLVLEFKKTYGHHLVPIFSSCHKNNATKKKSYMTPMLREQIEKTTNSWVWPSKNILKESNSYQM